MRTRSYSDDLCGGGVQEEREKVGGSEPHVVCWSFASGEGVAADSGQAWIVTVVVEHEEPAAAVTSMGGNRVKT